MSDWEGVRLRSWSSLGGMKKREEAWNPKSPANLAVNTHEGCENA